MIVSHDGGGSRFPCNVQGEHQDDPEWIIAGKDITDGYSDRS